MGSARRAARTDPTAAMLHLIETTRRLKELEAAADAAHRARTEAARERAATGKTLSPEARRKFTKNLLGAAARVAAAHASLHEHDHFVQAEAEEAEEKLEDAVKLDDVPTFS